MALPVNPGNPATGNNNYMSERIEKTLQKYSKKEISTTAATTTQSSANKQASRNNMFYPV